jgi:hypothetical protein
MAEQERNGQRVGLAEQIAAPRNTSAMPNWPNWCTAF